MSFVRVWSRGAQSWGNALRVAHVGYAKLYISHRTAFAEVHIVFAASISLQHLSVRLSKVKEFMLRDGIGMLRGFVGGNRSIIIIRTFHIPTASEIEPLSHVGIKSHLV